MPGTGSLPASGLMINKITSDFYPYFYCCFYRTRVCPQLSSYALSPFLTRTGTHFRPYLVPFLPCSLISVPFLSISATAMDNSGFIQGVDKYGFTVLHEACSSWFLSVLTDPLCKSPYLTIPELQIWSIPDYSRHRASFTSSVKALASLAAFRI